MVRTCSRSSCSPEISSRSKRAGSISDGKDSSVECTNAVEPA
jgi:hypothetical protein